MRSVRLIVLLVVLLSLMAFSQAQEMPPMPEIEGAEVFAEGLNGPQGILVDADGNVWVIDSGVGGEDEILFAAPGAAEPAPSPMGITSNITKISPDGEMTVVASLPSIFLGTDVLGGARLALLDGTLYATSGQWLSFNGPDRQELMGAVVSIGEDGTVTEVANTWAFEEANNPDGLIVDSHPYDIAAGPDGWLWVADAGGNSLIRVNPETGDIEGVAGFSKGLMGGFPNPNRNGAVEADPVPTGVVFDEDGDALVSFLSGAPFIPGNSKIVHVTPEGEVTDYATGLTMITDLHWGPDGELYAVQFGMFTQEGPVPNSGAIWRISEGAESEVVVMGLPFATSIDFDADGNAYVTINAVGAPGSGMVLKISDLVSREGMAMPAMGQ